MIAFSCSKCQGTIKVPDNQAGKRGVCGRCGQVVQVPDQSVAAKPAPKASRAGPPTPATRGSASVERRAFSPGVIAGILVAAGALILGGATFGFAWVMNRAAKGVQAAEGDRGGVGDASRVPQGLADNINPAADQRPAREHVVGEEMRFGDLGVTVTQAKQDTFGSVTSSGEILVHDGAFVITLGLKNYNPNRILEVGPQVEYAKLQDDVGNGYDPVRTRSNIGLPTDILGQIPRGKVLRLRADDKDEHDMLVFDRPVPGASTLRLTLETSPYGASGSVSVTVPLNRTFRIQLRADQPWQDTGVEAIEGAQLDITVRGSWRKGEASCDDHGFAPRNDPTQALLRQLREQHEAAMKEHISLARQLPAEKPVRRDAVPRRRPQESDESLQRRIAEYKQDIETRQRQLDDQRKQREVAHNKVIELNQRSIMEQNRLEGRRVVRKANLMCLLAKFGSKGEPFRPHQYRMTIDRAQVGRLYLQTNDLDLQENSGSLDVEIKFQR
jgi:hypothetical protein